MESNNKQSILIDQRKNRITITRRTIEVIGNPSHILLLVSPQERMIVISGCDSSDKRAHRVPPLKSTRQREVELYSKSLIQSIASIIEGWIENITYKIFGEFIRNENILRFRIDDFEPCVKGIKPC